jgi:hypothetical protein
MMVERMLDTGTRRNVMRFRASDEEQRLVRALATRMEMSSSDIIRKLICDKARRLGIRTMQKGR